MVNDMIFATNNAHKLQEVSAMLGGKIELKSLRDVGCTDDIPETADTLEGNALMKARYIHERYGTDCFADDTGLEVAALNGAPGVYSARYAGPGHDSEANMQKLLTELEGKSDRRAQFRTVIALIKEGKEYLFEGIVTGSILEEREEGEGFGYDPIFRPDGYEHSFARLGDKVKNQISHRARAVEKLVEFLKQ
ncbi:MAG: non-canonical purine NTP diphosphatase [Bacteroidaceae bacterium]|nr:non-canonical purine NTP diphosphatase [Bacteroidaceae bacterium]